MKLWCVLGGMVHLRDGANTQYVAGTAFLFSAYSDLLATYKQTAQCADKSFDSKQLMMFAKKQVLPLTILFHSFCYI